MDILFLAICAILSGCEGWEDIEDFGHAKLEWLRRYLPYANGIPRHDTIARVISRLCPDALQSSFMSWIQSIVQEAGGDIIAIDGKTARGSFTTRERNNPLHMVSAWSCNNSIVLGQQRVADKSNEITAIPVLLDLLDIDGCIITIDAMGCQKDIAKKIIENNGDYVLMLKGNQGNLFDEVKDWFELAEKEDFKNLEYDVVEQTDKGHGRIEVRRCLQSKIDINWLSKGAEWVGLQTVIKVICERHINDKHSVEERYYISSLPLNAADSLKAVRSHWQVENTLHWTLDMTFKEDASRIRRGNAAEAMNVLRKLALNLVKADTTRNASMKRKLKMAAYDDDFRAQLLCGAI